MTFSPSKSLILFVLDGLGVAPPSQGNAFSLAKTPFLDHLAQTYPLALLRASGKAVGLKEGMPGNGAAGHLTLGNGRPFHSYAWRSTRKPLSNVIAEAGLSQWKVFDAASLPLITYFFNGKREQPFPKEEWFIEDTLEALEKRSISFLGESNISSMVVSTSVLAEACRQGTLVKVVALFERLDHILNELVEITLRRDATLILTSSFAQSEDFFDPRLGILNRLASCNPVPFILVAKNYEGKYPWAQGSPTPVTHDWSTLSSIGTLANVAPTILTLMGLAAPKEMTGKSLIE